MNESVPNDILKDPALENIGASRSNNNEARDTYPTKDLDQFMPDILPTQQCLSPTRVFLKEGTREKQHSFSDILNVHKQESWINLSVERDLIKELEATARKPAQSDKSDLQKTPKAQSSIKMQFPEVEGIKTEVKPIPSSLSLSEDIFNNMGKKNHVRRACVLCKKGGKQIALGNPEPAPKSNENKIQQENFLIHPCLCNFMAHRECLRAYILSTKRANCEKCQVFYAIAGQERRIPFQQQPKIMAGFFAVVFCLLVSLGATIAGIVILTTTDQAVTLDPQIRYFWLVVTIVCGAMLVGIWIVATFRIIQSSRKKIITDLLVYCKQCEVDKHVQASDEILKQFLEQEEKLRNSQKLGEAKKLQELLDMDGFNEAMKSRDYFQGVYHQRSNDPYEIKYDLESLLVSRRSKVSMNKTSTYDEPHTIEIAEGANANRVVHSAKKGSHVFTSWAAGDLLTPSRDGPKEKIHGFAVSPTNTNVGGPMSGVISPHKDCGENVALKMNTWESASGTSVKKLESRRIPQKDFSIYIKDNQTFDDKGNDTCELRETEAAEYL